MRERDVAHIGYEDAFDSIGEAAKAAELAAGTVREFGRAIGEAISSLPTAEEFAAGMAEGLRMTRGEARRPDRREEFRISGELDPGLPSNHPVVADILGDAEVEGYETDLVRNRLYRVPIVAPVKAPE